MNHDMLPKTRHGFLGMLRRAGQLKTGDAVAAGIRLATLGKVKPCGPCEKRKQWLNEHVILPWQRREDTNDG